jgi:DNA invertase Pin-like site-specific DNA recombinase
MKGKKALCYLSDIILGQTGTIISREDQKKGIIEHAEKNGIEIVGFYEDEKFDEDVLSRPGVQSMLLDERPYDFILVDRVWVFSRSWPMLKKLLVVLSLKPITLETVRTMWDCTSQRSRGYFRGRIPTRTLEKIPNASSFVRERKPVQIKMPARLNFVVLKNV